MSIGPWFKCYPSDWLEGIRDLSLPAQGAYAHLVMRMYDAADAIYVDDARIGKWLNSNARGWLRIKQELIAERKLVELADGGLINLRCLKEMADNCGKQSGIPDHICQRIAKLSDMFAETLPIVSRNFAETSPEKPIETRPIIESRIQKPEIASNEAIPRASVETVDDLTEAFEAYQAIARKQKQQHGKSIWPEVKSFNAKRRKHLKARLNEHGLAAWGDVLRKAAASDFCCGRSNDFVASFDFLISPSGFLKTLEGNYDNRNRATSRQASGHTKPDRDGGIVDQFERFAEQMEADRAGSAHDAGYDARSDTGVIIDAEPIASTG